MKHCMECGAKLRKKYLDGEGMVPYCDHCQEYRFPVFNTAVSMIVTNEDQSKIILIRQYGRPHYILVAGYVNKGEDAEDAAVREVKEEMGLDVVKARFNHSHYFAPSNTLMLNFTVTVTGTEPAPNREIDSWRWFSREEALQQIKKGSLAGAFLKGYLTGEYSFTEADGIDPEELKKQSRKKILNLGMAQMSSKENLKEYIKGCCKMMREASQRDADLILFPEMQGTEPVDIDTAIIQEFCDCCRANHIMAVVTLSRQEGDKKAGISLFIDRQGQVISRQEMIHLPEGNDSFGQREGNSSEEVFKAFDTEFGRMGMVVGNDRHYPESVREEAEQGAKLILVPAACCTDEPMEIYEWEIRVQAYQNGTALAMCNLAGGEGENIFAGRSILAGADGSLLVKADSEEGLIFAEIDLEESSGPRYR